MSAAEDPTTRGRRVWDAMAPRYDRAIQPLERLLFRWRRRWICSRATGRVLDVAAGTGLNLPYYPPQVPVTGVDISRAMLSVARRRAATLGRPVRLCQADAQALPFPEHTFDTVVCTLSLCNIPDDAAAVAEMARVLRPGGRLLLLDHVASRFAWLRALQRAVERVTVPAAYEHFTRRPGDLLAGAGLRIVESHRSTLGMVELVHARRDG